MQPHEYSKIRATAFEIVTLLCRADYSKLNDLSDGKEMTGSDIEQWLNDRFRTIIMPPDSFFDALSIERSYGSGWILFLSLPTAEDGEGALSVVANLTDNQEELMDVGIYHLELESSFMNILALSGGGFRATLFHLGAIWRLNELGYLPRLDKIVSVSGGSILSGYLGARWSDLRFENGICTNFTDEIVLPVREFCAANMDTTTLLRSMMTPWKLRRPGNLLEKTYRLKLYGNSTLQDLPRRPDFEICSTDLLSGDDFVFSRASAGTTFKVKIEDPKILISECVAASSAFPPIFSPFRLEVSTHENRTFLYRQDVPLTERVLSPELSTQRPHTFYLSDGGVISNLGMGNVRLTDGKLFISDASASLRSSSGGWLGSTWIGLGIRSARIALSQADPANMDYLYERKGHGNVVHWAINMGFGIFQRSDTLACSDTMIRKLASMRTRLNSFSEVEQCELINWGYSICDSRMWPTVRQSRGGTDHVTRPRWPYQEYPLDA
jgi:NTE family protein